MADSMDCDSDNVDRRSSEASSSNCSSSSTPCEPEIPMSTSALPPSVPPPPQSLPRLRVLSLFDGIGTGLHALNKIKYDIEVFYACEVDEDAITLTKHHFGKLITHLGSVTKMNESELDKLGPINLLIGGSPCSDLSCVNPFRKGLYDPTGTGVLFFDYYKIWNYLKVKNAKNNTPFYWVFENVSGMEVKNKNIISKFLQSEPCIIDSLHLSPQRRKRFFWNNLPCIENMIYSLSIITKEYERLLDDCLTKNLGRVANVDKIGTITTKRTCLNDGKSKDPVTQNGIKTKLYITELELIFGFPAHYTDVCDFTIGKRHKLLGKAWSVPVIKIIFFLLHDKFAKINVTDEQ